MPVLSKVLTLTALVSLVAAQTLPSNVTTDHTSSPVSYVKGKAFNRFVTIWLENTDYDKAIGDPNLAWLASKGVTLSNYFGLTHPSEPNYVASVAGDYFGINNDNFNTIPGNVSSVVDLLEEKGISWGEYQDWMPWTGFNGFDFKDPVSHSNEYVRKHNPLIMFDSVNSNPDRAACIKNFTLFYDDLAANTLPQWMFITPTMLNDGHDTSVTYAGNWTRSFVEPLLNDPHFMNNTLVLITFDENHTYTAQNRVLGILLGDAVPAKLVGTTDAAYYNHYSELSTVEANWGLHTLGRYDVGANVFSMVAKHTGDSIRTTDITNIYNNQSYPGIFNTAYGLLAAAWAPQPVPDTHARRNGRTVLESIKKTWRSLQWQSVYTYAPLDIPTAANPPVYPNGTY